MEPAGSDNPVPVVSPRRLQKSIDEFGEVVTEAKRLPMRWAWTAGSRNDMWRFSGASTMSLISAASIARSSTSEY